MNANTATNWIESENLPGASSVWFMLRRRYLRVISGLLTGVALATVYVLWVAPAYESSARILVMNKGAMFPRQGVESGPNFQRSMGEELLATHMLILQSARLVKTALTRDGLADRASIVDALDYDQDAVEYVIENLRIHRGGEGQTRSAHVINVQFRHGHAQDCADVVESIVESYQDFLQTTLSSPVDEALELISHAKDEIAENLSDARSRYQMFREQAPLLGSGTAKLNVHLIRLEKLESALADLRLIHINTHSRLRTISEVAVGDVSASRLLLENLVFYDRPVFDNGESTSVVSPPESLADPLFHGNRPEHVETAKTKFHRLLALRIREQELLSDFGRDHPDIRRVRRGIQQVEAFLNDKTKELEILYFRALRRDLQDVQHRQQEIEKLLDAERDAARTLVQTELKDEALRNELDRNQQLFDAVVERLDEIHLAKDYGGFTTELIAPVELGEQVSPNITLVLMIGAMLGLCLGVVTTFAVNPSHSTFCSDKEISVGSASSRSFGPAKTETPNCSSWIDPKASVVESPD